MLFSLFLAAVSLWTVKPGQLGWVKVTCKEGGFSVNMPGSPTVAPVEKLTTKIGTVTLHMFTLKWSGGLYFVSFADIANGKLETAEQTFRGARDRIVKSMKAKILTERRVSLGNVPGSELVAEVPPGAILRMRTYRAEKRGFQICAATRKSDAKSPDADRFLGSFKLLGK